MRIMRLTDKRTSTAERVFRVALLALIGLFAVLTLPPTAQARWDVERKATQTHELPDTRLFSNEESRVLGYSLLTRTIETRHGDIPVATITNSVLKKSVTDTPATPEAMAEQVRQTLGSPKWKSEKHAGVSFFEASWPAQHRLIRLAIKVHGDRYLVSFANVRAPFIKIGGEESDVLQRAFFVIETRTVKSRAKKTAQNTESEFAARHSVVALVAAQMLPNANAITTPEVLNLLRGFQQSVRDITDNVGINSANSLAGAIKGIGGDLNASSAQLGADIKSSADQLSSTVKKTISFKNGFVFGLGIGVGTALGTAATNFFLDGSAKLAREAWYAMIGRMKPEERARIEARASKSFDDFVNSSQRIEDIENELTIFGMAATEAIGRPGVAIAELSEAQAFEYRDQMEKLKKRLSESKTTDEARVCSQELSRLDSILRYKEAMRPILMQHPTLPRICERIESLLENWKIAEAQLHQSKMVVASEMSTLLDGIRSKALDSLPEDVSFRKRVNECEARIDDLVSRHEDLYKVSDCEKGGPGVDADSCQLYSTKIAKLKNSKPSCTTDAKSALASVSPQSLNRSIELMDDQVGILRKRFSSIAKADCREGETASPCDGKVGDLETLRDRYRQRVNAAREACPNMNLIASDSGSPRSTVGVPGGAVTDTPARENQGRSIASVADSGQTPESTGIFTRVWSSIRRFFGFN